MAKEYHITFSCETFEASSKANIGQIRRLMTEGGAELISKNDDDGYMDIVFHHHSSPEKVSNLCNKVFEYFKHSYFPLSTSVYEHKPSVLIDIKDVKDLEQFKEFVKDLANNQGYIDLKTEIEEPDAWKISFEKSSQRQAFQNDFTAKAGEYMTKGHSSVNIFPEWEDINLLQKNNYNKFDAELLIEAKIYLYEDEEKLLLTKKGQGNIDLYCSYQVKNNSNELICKVYPTAFIAAKHLAMNKVLEQRIQNLKK